MKKRHFFEGIYILCIFFSLAAQAQSPNAPQLPKLTPQSPEAAAMSRYGEYPVTMFTGLADISIPLYEIKTGKFTIPIVLRYHASGNKVNDFAGWTGLGWSLDAGGRVSHKVMGRDDQTFNRNVRTATTIDPQNATDMLYLKNVADQTGDDTEPDIYSFNFPGQSGRFIFGDSMKPIMIPYCGVKVQDYHNPNKLIDENGNNFIFGSAEYLNTYYSSGSGQTEPPSSWWLTKIYDSGKTDSVSFSYQSLGYGTLGMDYVDYVAVNDNVIFDNQCDWVPAYSSGMYPSSYSIKTYGTETVPSHIDFSQGKVKFIPSSTNRLDRIFTGDSTGFKTLNRIEIYSLEDTVTPIKTIVFYQSYFNNFANNKRLKLDSLRILDKNSQNIQTYKFAYNTSIDLPSIDSKSKDLWGYFNNQSNSSLLPGMTVDFIEDNYGITIYPTIGSTTINGRDPNPDAMQAYILNRITYPTGGYTTFEYETNKYLDNQTPKYAGGLRIHKIRSYTTINVLATTKTYKYGDNESGYGRFNVFLNDFYFTTPAVNSRWIQCNCLPGLKEGYMRSRTFTSNLCTDLNPYDGSPVVYSTVTEYTGDETNNTGKTIYKYTDDADHLGSYVILDKSFKEDRSFRRGLLDSKTEYKYEGGRYKKISFLQNTYFAFPTQNNYLSLKVVQRVQYDGCRTIQNYDDYGFVNTPIFHGDNLLNSTYEYTYDSNDTTKYVVKSTNYNYNSYKYTQPSKIISTCSTQDTITKILKYSTDISTGYYPEMETLNIIGVPVYEYQVKNQTDSLYSKRTNFNKYHNKLFAPSSVDFKTGTNPWEKRIVYSSYDGSGNLLSVKKDKDIPICYLYNKYNQPVAEVANADTNSIFFNDFENTDGNSSLNDCRTGRKSRTGTYSKSLSGLQSGDYILSWWSKSGGVWSFNSESHTITGSYNISLTGQVDDVRLYPKSSSMKTYTYDPLIGITSMTDQNNITTYYEYDDFGRLKYIKDQNKNILKAFDYHYNSQAINP